MKAIVVHAGDPAPRLSWEPVADPGLDKGEVLVEVRAISGQALPVCGDVRYLV